MHIFRREMIRDVPVITLEIQSLDAHNVSRVTECIAEAIRGETLAVVDLGALRYFDVSGFAAILKLAASTPGGPAVSLCSRSGAIQSLLELLRAHTVVTLYQSREEAIASLRNVNSPHRRTVNAQYTESDPLPGQRIA